jgi:DNA-binding CsgD family transcriptional regulator
MSVNLDWGGQALLYVTENDAAGRRRLDDVNGTHRSASHPHRDQGDFWQGGQVASPSELAAAWFNMDRHPCFLLASNCRIVAANPQAEQMLHADRAVSISGGILTFRCERSQQTVKRAVAAVGQAGSCRQRSVIRGDDSEWRTIEVVSGPDRGCVFATFNAAPVAHDLGRDMNTLSEAFGLTRTETCVLAGLIDGRAPKEIAGQLQISTHTVRSHLRAIYAKMEVKGISGTIRLAMRLSQ